MFELDVLKAAGERNEEENCSIFWAKVLFYLQCGSGLSEHAASICMGRAGCAELKTFLLYQSARKFKCGIHFHE